MAASYGTQFLEARVRPAEGEFEWTRVETLEFHFASWVYLKFGKIARKDEIRKCLSKRWDSRVINGSQVWPVWITTQEPTDGSGGRGPSGDEIIRKLRLIQQVSFIDATFEPGTIALQRRASKREQTYLERAKKRYASTGEFQTDGVVVKLGDRFRYLSGHLFEVVREP